MLKTISKRNPILAVILWVEEQYWRGFFPKLDVITRGTWPEIKNQHLTLTGWGALFSNGLSGIWLGKTPTILNYKSRYQCFFKSSWKQFKLVKKTCKALDLKKKSAACFVFATTTWSREVGVAYLPGRATPMFPRQLLKAIIVMHVNELKSFKKIKIDDQKKNLNEKKKVSCECSGSIFKKTKQTTATKNKKQFTHQSDSESHCGLLTRKKKKEKEITTSDSRAAISSSAPPKWRKTTKKIEIESVFHVFSTTLQKDELFSFWWPYLCPLALPSHLNL